jgi:hypothetical protein
MIDGASFQPKLEVVSPRPLAKTKPPSLLPLTPAKEMATFLVRLALETTVMEIMVTSRLKRSLNRRRRKTRQIIPEVTSKATIYSNYTAHLWPDDIMRNEIFS